MKLPESLDELEGLRAAHWARESTGRQADRFGPEAQREQRDAAVRRYGLQDTGISWMIAHSGKTVGSTVQFADMLARAGVDYDVLVVGYVSRFARDLRTAVNARHALHQAGAALLFADERVLSSDEDAWETWAREAVEAEAYSRRLGKRVREGFAAKRRRFADPGGGLVSLGFRRNNETKLLEADPAGAALVLRAYELAAAGHPDRLIAAELGVTTWQVRTVLRSTLYAGRLADGTPTRVGPLVPEELRQAAAAVRAARTRSGHQHGRHRVYPLTNRGPLACASCGRFLKGAFKTDRQVAVYRHDERCDAWRVAETPAALLDAQVEALLRGASPNRETAARVVAALQSNVVPVDRLEVARIDARLRSLALSLVEAQDRDVLTEMEQLRRRKAELLSEKPAQASQIDPRDALAWLGDLGQLWADTDAESRRELAVALFARLGAVDRRIVEVEVTPWAERRGLSVALPGQVTVVGDTGESPRPVTWSVRIVGDFARFREETA